MSGPLQGIKVFDMTQQGVGPLGTTILTAMGANIIKIEPPQGDGIRQMSPRYNDLAAVYTHGNLGKKGIYLDLKSEEGKQVAQGLLKEADIYAENMKWGAALRLGFGYDDISKLNPSIVYANFPGWGHQHYRCGNLGSQCKRYGRNTRQYRPHISSVRLTWA